MEEIIGASYLSQIIGLVVYHLRTTLMELLMRLDYSLQWSTASCICHQPYRFVSGFVRLHRRQFNIRRAESNRPNDVSLKPSIAYERIQSRLILLLAAAGMHREVTANQSTRTVSLLINTRNLPSSGPDPISARPMSSLLCGYQSIPSTMFSDGHHRER